MRRLTAAAAATAVLAVAHAAPANNGRPINDASANPLTVAVIGDTPYGPEQQARFPELIDAINADPTVRVAVHLGDIKSGSTRCDDEYFAAIAADFDSLRDPLVYTPGDNEWTDCHRTNNGSYNPLERLTALRNTFFADPGSALGGRPMHLLAEPGFPENVSWMESKVVFATIHVVGSNNGYAPWTGIGNAAATPEQTAEVDARIAAALDWIGAAFEAADEHGALGVVLMMQADIFLGANELLDGFDEIVARIGAEAALFGSPVLLLQGDTHSFLVDAPYTDAPNLTRIVVQGETVGEWLRLTIDPRSPGVFSWERQVA